MLVLVVGTGSIGMRQLKILHALPQVVAVAVPVRPGRADELRRLGFETALDLQSALSRGPAGALIATDTSRHVADAAVCLEACDALVEKPLAATAAGGRQLQETAERLRRRLHVAFCLRFDDGLRWLRDRLSSLGAIRAADVECLSWLPDWRPDRALSSTYSARPGEGGVLLDLIHEIDYCGWLLGRPTRVFAHLENRQIIGLPPVIEETARLLLEHADGLRTTIRLSYAVRPPSRRLRVWGEHGLLVWDGVNRKAERLDVRGTTLESFSWEGPQRMYQAQAEAWLSALRGVEVPPLASGSAGVEALAVCDAARQSAREQSWANVA
jgi:predicted dehydrogenase